MWNSWLAISWAFMGYFTQDWALQLACCLISFHYNYRWAME